MSDFKIALKRTLKFEGGYSDDPDDRGGKTNYGITERTARSYGYTGKMKDITLEKAEEIYKDGYWDPLKLDLIDDQAVANRLFDIAVLRGIRTAGILFQTTINLMYPDNVLKTDGIVGDKTIKKYISTNKKDRIRLYIKSVHISGIVEIAIQNLSQRKFLYGWLRRAYSE